MNAKEIAQDLLANNPEKVAALLALPTKENITNPPIEVWEFAWNSCYNESLCGLTDWRSTGGEQGERFATQLGQEVIEEIKALKEGQRASFRAQYEGGDIAKSEKARATIKELLAALEEAIEDMDLEGYQGNTSPWKKIVALAKEKIADTK